MTRREIKEERNESTGIFVGHRNTGGRDCDHSYRETVRVAMDYPGDLAEPKDVARWMATVAEEEFGLPGILPVMTSCVELTAAWTGPGDVKDVPGYLYAQDHDSLGYFQQRPSAGWGLPAQLINADYALRAFCKAAKDQYRSVSETDAAGLGRWCADVQQPFEAYRDRYETKGYPMARELLDATEGEGQDWPELAIKFDPSGWAYDAKDGLWLRSDRKNLAVDKDGWVYDADARDVNEWEWPEANDPPIPGSIYYEERCPTRYSWREGGRGDVEAWARYLVNNYNVYCNTYHHHPESVWIEQGVSREYDSIDVWGPGGRDDAIDPAVGNEVFNLLFNDLGLPNIDWLIWQEVMYGAWNGWNGEPFGDGSEFTAHRNHIHCTYL